MFDTVCTIPLESELFAQAVHPTAPLITVGLASGHVAALRLPPVDEEEEDDDDDDDDEGEVKNKKTAKSSNLGQHSTRRGSNGTGFIDTAWRTKRHKGSCRCLAYSLDGRQLYSAGTDGIVKAADSATGQVSSKIAIPRRASTAKDPIDGPTVVHALSPQTLLLATDSGALHLYDLRSASTSSTTTTTTPAFADSRPSQTYHPHTDYVSSLAPIPASATSTSGFSKQWLTTGSTTLALTDLRRGVLAKSADQEELLLASVYATGLPARRGGTGGSGEKAVVGGGDGVLTLWEKGQWDDQDERIVVSREKETLDCLAHVPMGVGGPGARVAVGMGDGRVCIVRLGVNKVVAEVRHDEQEGVMQLGFDANGRMVSGGGQTIKVWQEHIEAAEESEDEDAGATKRRVDSDEDSDDDGEGEDDEDSSDEDAPRQPRKKRRKGKGPPGGNAKKFDFSGLD